jgi:hypothetical protein
VARASQPRTHRFVVVYRAEAREIDGADEVRRGWVERVPDPRAADAGDTERDRSGFRMLTELPELIESMIEKVEGGSSRPTKGRPPE